MVFVPVKNRFAYLDPSDVAYTLHALRELPRAVGLKHLRIGLNAWGGEVKNVLAFASPVESSALKKSHAVKVKIPDASFNKAHHGKPAYVIVGPKRKAGKFFRRTPKGKLVGHGDANRELRQARRIAAALGAGRNTERLAARVAKRRHPRTVFRLPSRYAHLAERHHKFFRRAEAVGRRLAQTTMVHKISQGVQAESRRLATSQTRR